MDNILENQEKTKRGYLEPSIFALIVFGIYLSSFYSFLLFHTIAELFSIIIAVGATKSVVSPEFLSDLPRELIKNLPNSIDELYFELKKIDLDDTDMDDDGKIWIRAILNAKTTPRSIVEKSGISIWLKDELSVSLKARSVLFLFS